MKFALPLLAVASLVAAQNPLNDIPKCAQDCVGKYLSGSNIAGCSLLDYKCVCSNEKFIDDIACCLEPVCDDKGKADTIALANKLCKAFSVDLPSAVTCKSAATASSTAASSGSAATGSATSAGAGKTTTAASSGATSTGAAASTTSSKANAAPTNVAGLVGAAAAALAFAL